MRHELDIADVEARTKIRAKYLRALENEEFGGAARRRPRCARSSAPTPSCWGWIPTRWWSSSASRARTARRPTSSRCRRRRAGETVASAGSGGSGARPRRRRGGRGGPSPLALIAGTLIAVLVLLAVIGLIGGEEEGGEREVLQRGPDDPEHAGPAPKPKPKRKRRRRTQATLSVAPTVPTYVCVDTGPGTEIVFEGTLDSSRNFKAKRVRLNLGKTSAKLTANGKAVPLEPSPTPVGYDVTPTKVQPLEAGQRPCA